MRNENLDMTNLGFDPEQSAIFATLNKVDQQAILCTNLINRDNSQIVETRATPLQNDGNNNSRFI